MSIYHKKCATSDSDNPGHGHPHKTTTKTEKEVPLRLKPFCECKGCTSKNCPDILKRLAIKVTDKSCQFDPKLEQTRYSKEQDTTSEHILLRGEREEPMEADKSNLLDLISQDRDCTCGVMARAMRSHDTELYDIKNVPHENPGTKDSLQK